MGCENMNTYEVVYMEKVYHTFCVDADSEEEAKNKLYTDPSEFDWSNGEVYDSEIISCEKI